MPSCASGDCAALAPRAKLPAGCTRTHPNAATQHPGVTHLAKRKSQRRPILGQFEALEKREMFDASPFQLSGKTLNVNGTSGNDMFEFTAGPTYRVALNGEVRTYDPAAVTRINFDGKEGVNQAIIVGGASAETAKLQPASATVTGSGYALKLQDIAKIEMLGDAADQALLYDSKQNDTFVSSPTRAELSGATFNHIVSNFGKVTAYASAGGVDTAALYDSAGDDALIATPAYNSLTGAAFYVYASEFDSVVAFASAGNDIATMFDSNGNDTLTAQPDSVRLAGAKFDNLAKGFDRVNANARAGGLDKAYLTDSRGNDSFVARPTAAYLTGAGYYNNVEQFDEVYGSAIYGGNDTAWLYDSTGNDSFVAKPGLAYLSGSNFYNSARDFDRVNGYATGGGNDTAWLNDSSGDDTLDAYSTYASLKGASFELWAHQFDRLNASAAGGGNDQAFLYDSTGDDAFVGRPTYSYLSGNGFYNNAEKFDSVQAYAGSGGLDTAWLYDSAGDEVLLSRSTTTSLSGTGFFYSASKFNRLYAYATAGGYDTGTVYGTAAVDTFWARDVQGRMSGAGYSNYFTTFDTIRTYIDAADRTDASDVAYELIFDNDLTTAVTIEGGVQYPFKVLSDPTQPNALLAITGSGESGGTGYLYRLDASTLQPLGQPLNVGTNASDLKMVGQHLVVASRGSSDLHSIDLVKWKVADRIVTVKEAMSIAPLPNNHFAVVGIQSERIQLLSLAPNGKFTLVREASIGGVSYDVTASPDGSRLYVNLPNASAVAVLDANTLNTVRTYNTGGSPSYGGLAVGNYYLATDRDGFIRVINTTTHVITSINIAPLLGLDPATVPLRGIDPKDFLVVGPNRMLLVNDRQDSVLLDLDLAGPTPSVTVLGKTTGSASGTYLPATSEAILVQPSLHRINRVRLDQPGLPITRVLVGIGLGASVRWAQAAGGPAVAVLTSQHKLMLIDEQTRQVREFIAPRGFSFAASSPLTIDGDGNLVTVAYATNRTWRLVRINPQGQVVGAYAIQLDGSVYSMQVSGQHAQLVDRLNSQVQIVNFASGDSTKTVLARTRARSGFVFGDGSWLVVHDTNPDIGVSLSRGGVTEFFAAPVGVRWFSDAVQLDAQRAVLAGFGGKLAIFNAQTKSYGSIVSLPFDGVTNVYLHGNTIYAISPTAGKVAVVDATTFALRDVWSVTDVVGLAPAPGGAWVITNSAVIWKRLA